MRNRSSLNNFLNRDRKKLYIVLGIVLVCVATLTMAYAALSTTLEITGNAEVTAASWDIYLDNVQLNSNSSTTGEPTITDKTTASFTTTLSKPGDFYEFSIDVVNDGSIDVVIDSVTKTPTLTEAQAKYLNYIVEYQNGEAINTKQLVAKESFVRLKVKVEFRKDITASDLPTQSESLNLSFKVNYVQSDDSNGTVSIDNNGRLIKVVSGDYDTVGSEICIGEECFYVISSDETSVTMFAKYNLHVGGVYDDAAGTWTAYGNEATGIQNSSVLGFIIGQTLRNGTSPFSLSNYWAGNVSSSPAYICNSNSLLYNYVENYKTYLENQGVLVDEARLIKVEELENLGCSMLNNSCENALKFVLNSSYWTGSTTDGNLIWYVASYGPFDDGNYDSDGALGVRPIVKISKSKF